MSAVLSATGLTKRYGGVTALAGAGRAGSRIDDELASDNTISGQEHAAAARASQPDAEAKHEAWRLAVLDSSTPNETARSITLAFPRAGQEELLAPYVEEYLSAAETIWESLGTHRASVVLDYIFPVSLASDAVATRMREWLDSSDAPAPAKRFVQENLADVERALAAQACDAGR